MELLGPGDWYGDIALIDHSPVDLDIVAQVHSTVLIRRQRRCELSGRQNSRSSTRYLRT